MNLSVLILFFNILNIYFKVYKLFYLAIYIIHGPLTALTHRVIAGLFIGVKKIIAVNRTTPPGWPADGTLPLPV